MTFIGKIVIGRGRVTAIFPSLSICMNHSTRMTLRNNSSRRVDISSLVVAIDQGTTSTRCIIFDGYGKMLASAREPITLHTPHPGWVEQDAEEIFKSVQRTIDLTIRQLNLVQQKNIVAIGLTNQRETIVAWDSISGKAVTPAIVWMDRRTALDGDFSFSPTDPLAARITQLTGLRMAPYFSATKMGWLRQHCDAFRDSIKWAHLCIGTIDAWILWKLAGKHQTDPTNAHRTLLVDLERGRWNKELLSLFNIEEQWLPQIVEFPNPKPIRVLTGPLFDIPITAVMGDQHASLFGHQCEGKGEAKITLGTGMFLLINVGQDFQTVLPPPTGFLATIAFVESNEERHDVQLSKTINYRPLPTKYSYAWEAPIAAGGSTLEWAKELFFPGQEMTRLDELAANDSNGVFFIPHLTGALAPHWNEQVNGGWFGLRLEHHRGHLLKSIIDSLAFSIKQVFERIPQANFPISRLSIDGGLASSDVLLQTIANVLERPIIRLAKQETTAWGIAKMAARNAGLSAEWGKNQGDDEKEQTFYPIPECSTRLLKNYRKWLELETNILVSTPLDH